MKRNFKNHAVVGVCALGLIGLNSCQVDDAYDLDKEIDKTITVGGDLTIPASSTDNMMLKDLLEIEEGSAVQADAEGNYNILQKGDDTNTDVEVPAVNVDLNFGFTGVEQSFNLSSAAGGKVTVSLDEDIVIDVVQDGITSDIKSISSAVTSSENTYLVFSLTGNAGSARLVKGYSIVFPEYLTVEALSEGWNGNENVLELVKEEGMDITASTKVRFQISGISFEENGAEFINNEGATDNNSIVMGGSISLDGDIEAVANGNGGSIAIGVDVEADMMSVDEVKAVVDPEVDITIDPITLNDMPEFLSDDEVSIALTDPKIYIHLTNPSPVAVDMTADLWSYKTGKEDQKVSIPTFRIPANKPNGYTICINSKADAQETGVDEFVTVENLGDIIKFIPERIEMKNIVTEAVQEEITVKPGVNYNITTGYEVKTPLMFTEGTNIVYTETMDGWGSDLKDIEFNEIEATMSVNNQLPLGVKMSAVAVDNTGNVLDNVVVDMDMDIMAGATSDVKFNVTTTDGSIKGLDGLKLTVTATGSEETSGVCLNENQYIKITELKLKLKGGITMEL